VVALLALAIVAGWRRRRSIRAYYWKTIALSAAAISREG
jgi:hypothetical protein